ncbi:hypothetical protein [Neobacillus drentensis]|uniref:hypothetical protein n=1 Tax=Neobacillus drentensis TaxID=220684 RepID=UPI00082664CA|nr:hypothetical protein [Neobacillus drentensis]
MFSFENDHLLVDDREDLIAVLRMRFGELSGGMIQEIYEIDDMNTLQRLILAAANAANWDIFLEELQSGKESFRLLGEEFNPLADLLRGRDDSDAV